jgi:hypothetical protein
VCDDENTAAFPVTANEDALALELARELKSIQTLQIVVGSNTIYCQ